MGFFVATAIAYFYFIVPAYNSLQSSRQDEASRAQFVQNEQASVKKVQGLISTYQGQTALEDTISQALPQTPDISGALLQLNGIARIIGLSMGEISVEQALLGPNTQAPANQESTSPSGRNEPLANIAAPLGTLTFKIQLTGSYEEFKNFVKEVETNIRIFNIQSFEIQPKAESQGMHAAAPANVLNYTVTILAYYQSQNPSPQ